MRDECYSTDRINAVCEQLDGFILNEILDPRGEFYHDGHIHRGLSIDLLRGPVVGL